MNIGQNIPGFVSLDLVGKGAPYILQAGHGQHVAVNGGIRSLLTRKEDTNGHFGMTECFGDVAPATNPHKRKRGQDSRRRSQPLVTSSASSIAEEHHLRLRW